MVSDFEATGCGGDVLHCGFEGRNFSMKIKVSSMQQYYQQYLLLEMNI